jgi:predicted nuclease of predicted toxin-antitoxin system
VKLLFDENLSPQLVDLLSDLYPGSAHVHQCGLGSADDLAIWGYAKANGFTIASKDSDFEVRSILLGAPPKIICIRTGNCASAEVENHLRAAFEIVRKFIEEDTETYLILEHRQGHQ